MTRTIALALGTTLLTGLAAQAQDYPTQPIRMVVPFSAGGTTDVLARIVAPAMAEHLGQNVLVENVGGAGGRIGTEQVSRAEADGYTILFGNMGPMAVAMALFDDMTYDPREALAPVGIVADVPMVLSVSNASGVTDLEAFLERLRTEGEDVNFGTAGFGATSNLAPTLLLHQTGLEGTLIPYQGAGPAIVDLMAGMVDAVIDQTPTLVPAHLNNQSVAVAVSGDARLAALPDVPTFAEGGVDFDMTVWNAIAAPVGTPDEVIARLAEALEAALTDERVRARFDELSVPPLAEGKHGHEALATQIAFEIDRWGAILGTE
ncbi:tripartite tricarboxylate transporter substrate binding protein [Pararhodobacter sp. CCB-MM2]|uniref:Bug family tripartite tricarboxylate transporter substrate binding protein n=1 Tax=Pararhodobacter sp. CCB-MM2 TaxID=1786003 RepID=UPI00082E2E9D|nr:tripartite tricarboxylate transporter substrate-binding protein [Pararhodobacter sp. CCB-MM2]